MTTQLLHNRYKFEKVLGQGGMGKVYLMHDTNDQKLVAVKECVTKNDLELIARVKREYYFMTQIEHPFIVRATDLFDLEGKYFIVMEYVQGITLNEFIKTRKNRIDFLQQLKMSRDICKAITVLHNNGIIHRDLKPSNIVIQENLQPKILDLGIAKSTNEELTEITKTGHMVGTPSYMSPEQIDSTKHTLQNTDVFSLATIFYQFFSWEQHSPFYADGLIQTIDKVHNHKLPPILSKLGNVEAKSIVLSNLLVKALKKDPQKRISSVEEMLKIFENIIGENFAAIDERMKKDQKLRALLRRKKKRAP